ncbi:MAG: ABC transporter permease [Lachnospiraceae bacterium]
MNRKSLSFPYIIWIIGFTIIPLIFIIQQTLTDADGNFTLQNLTAIADPLHRKALLLSVELAFICTIICILLAYPLAMILKNSRMKQQNVILFILVLPMWMNFILRILALQMLISNNGIINYLLTAIGLEPMQFINTPGAIVFGMVYDYLPYMILPIMNTIMAIPADIIEASKDLGASKFQTFFRIILPLSLPGVGSGITMVFVPSMTEFVIANILGGGKLQLLGNIIEQEFTVSMNWHLGSGLSVALMLFVLITSLLLGRQDSEEKGLVL